MARIPVVIERPCQKCIPVSMALDPGHKTSRHRGKPAVNQPFAASHTLILILVIYAFNMFMEAWRNEENKSRQEERDREHTNCFILFFFKSARTSEEILIAFKKMSLHLKKQFIKLLIANTSIIIIATFQPLLT